MKTMSLRALGAAFSLATLLLAPGCGNSEIIDPVIEIPDKRSLVVMPFKDEGFPNGFMSPRGGELASLVARILKEKADFKVISMDRVLELYNDADPRALTAKQVAEKLNADYVLMGDVLQWQLQDPDMYGGLHRGNSTLEMSIYETSAAAADRTPKEAKELKGKGRLAVSHRRVTALFPQEYGTASYGTYEMSEKEIEAGLKNATALSVSWILVGHTKDEEKLASAK
ncbi:hypothetical protein HY251_11725 [bacterium]|nr:hypothetical protein [bacterium]